ncbi:potassium/sodium hyperpolarization-activated cyclic nucleotide-gated channel 1-like [Copidosoma floridanum]|uniref:potassium/sodium hyperpolarization-activated cyclic nucleotide-gated channel 1-like n=1 Tax=Copidosoma floridanum TaxID=29053 RepID=UPI0006C97FD5|nr:potassium/sodium hyperpolarization-activated cyclic nucleotide-gated channel 1-like [Copidosoma floridanum]
MELQNNRLPSTSKPNNTIHNYHRKTREGRVNNLLSTIHKSFMASHKSRSAQKYLRSHASIDYEQRYHLRHNRHIIHPFSTFRYYWNTLMVTTMTVGLIIFPYQAAFDMTRNYTLPWTVVKNTFLSICCVDMAINFLTGFFDKTQSLVEMKPKRIASRYSRQRFTVDFLGSFPTDLIFVDDWEHHIVSRELCSLLFIFRIFSLSNYSNQIAKELEIRRPFYDILSMTFSLVMILHWQACLFWIVPVAAVSVTLPQKPDDDSWINSVGLMDNASDISKYGHCLLRAVATFMHAGFLANSEPKTIEDQYLVITFQFIGTLIFCFLIARIMQFFKGFRASRLKYQSTVAHLLQYMSHKQLPRRTQNRIVNYYQFRFQGHFYRNQEILNVLSQQLRQEIRMYSCRKLVENVTFFKSLPNALLSRIVTLLKSEFFLVNDVIVKANQTGDCMYFIASGTVAVYTLTGREVCHLEDGAYFGEIALVMPDAKRVASVVAVETCKVYRLERADFARTIHPYPLLWDRIKKIAVERHEKTTILNAE